MLPTADVGRIGRLAGRDAAVAGDGWAARCVARLDILRRRPGATTAAMRVFAVALYEGWSETRERLETKGE